MKRRSAIREFKTATKHARRKLALSTIVAEPSEMMTRPYLEKVSKPNLQELSTSTPTITIKWLPSADCKIERTLIESIPVALIQALSKYCCTHIKALAASPDHKVTDGHFSPPLVLSEGNGNACTLVFQWIVAHVAGFNLLEDHEFGIAPLHQCYTLLKASEELGVHAIRSHIWKKMEQVKKEQFRYSDVIPLLLVHGAGTDAYKYVVEGVSDTIVSGWLPEDEKNLMVIRTHYPVFAVDLDEALERKRIAAALQTASWSEEVVLADLGDLRIK